MTENFSHKTGTALLEVVDNLGFVGPLVDEEVEQHLVVLLRTFEGAQDALLYPSLQRAEPLRLSYLRLGRSGLSGGRYAELLAGSEVTTLDSCFSTFPQFLQVSLSRKKLDPIREMYLWGQLS